MRVLETIVHLTPLGIRCVDLTTQIPVTRGLRITAAAIEGYGRTIVAHTTSSGVYAFHGMPGLHDFEFGMRPELLNTPPVTSPPFGKEFVIVIEDVEGRYLPSGIILTAPRNEIIEVPLFSAPSRATVPGLAVVRGSVSDASLLSADGKPRFAAHARVKAEYAFTASPNSYATLADARGEFAVHLPFPNPLRPPLGMMTTSPNTTGRKTLGELRWPVTLSFDYQPARQRFVCLRTDGGVEVLNGPEEEISDALPPGWRCAPELASLLQQTAAYIAQPAFSPPIMSLKAEVEFGKETVVRSTSKDSRISLLPAVSP